MHSGQWSSEDGTAGGVRGAGEPPRSYFRNPMFVLGHPRQPSAGHIWLMLQAEEGSDVQIDVFRNCPCFGCADFDLALLPRSRYFASVPASAHVCAKS